MCLISIVNPSPSIQSTIDQLHEFEKRRCCKKLLFKFISEFIVIRLATNDICENKSFASSGETQSKFSNGHVEFREFVGTTPFHFHRLYIIDTVSKDTPIVTVSPRSIDSEIVGAR